MTKSAHTLAVGDRLAGGSVVRTITPSAFFGMLIINGEFELHPFASVEIMEPVAEDTLVTPAATPYWDERLADMGSDPALDSINEARIS